MKTAAPSPLRISSKLCQDAKSVLQEGESLPQFIEQAVRRQIELRKANAAFRERGLALHQISQQTKRYIDADVVLGKLRARLEAAFSQQLK